VLTPTRTARLNNLLNGLVLLPVSITLFLFIPCISKGKKNTLSHLGLAQGRVFTMEMECLVIKKRGKFEKNIFYKFNAITAVTVYKINVYMADFVVNELAA
jgi:hypothetical protein